MILGKILQIHCKETVLVQQHKKAPRCSERWPDTGCCVLHARGGGTELNEEILSEREQMFYRCLTDVCVAFEMLRGDGW